MIRRTRANTLLGCPQDARLLIINADDFGMCQAVNDGVLEAIKAGVVRSTTLMTPWPGASQAIQMLRENPDIPFGVHLSVMCDNPAYRQGPLAPAEMVRSLVDESGRFRLEQEFYESVDRIRLNELEIEYRAQIDAVVHAGLRPTHLDWHCGDGGRADILEMSVGLAREYGLALRVWDQAWIDRLQGQGLPTQEHDGLDSYCLDLVGKSAMYEQMLRELPSGLSEWAVHPGRGEADMPVAQPDAWQVRQTDYAFLVSDKAHKIIEREGIVLLSYEPLQRLWATRISPV